MNRQHNPVSAHLTTTDTANSRRTVFRVALIVCVGVLTGNQVTASERGNLCGNAVLDLNESCDDGNAVGGDGCSAFCLTEPGYECSAPYQPLELANDSIMDGGFEAGSPNPYWDENSAVFGTPLCNTGACPDEPGSRKGAWWVRLGSVEVNDLASVRQTAVVFDSTRYLRFALQKHSCGNPGDLFRVYVDNAIVYQNTGGGEGCFDMQYSTVTVDLQTAPGGPYNDDQPHSFLFEGRTTQQGQNTVFSVDEVQIGKAASAPFPSVCAPAANQTLFEDFDPPTGGDLDSLGFTQVQLGEFELPWGTTDDGMCGSGDIPPGNFTGGGGEAACIDSNAAGPGQVEAYLCTPELDWSTTVLNQLSVLVNYQPGNSGQDFFSISVGTEPPDAGSIGNYETFFSTGDNLGAFGQLPGAEIQLDLSGFDFKPQVWVCFGFGGDDSLYAQVDSVAFSFEGCVDEFDGDKLENCFDNCINASNFPQRDSDNDGYGNACDADIATGSVQPQALANGNDCVINFQDLGVLKESFFMTPMDGKWNPDADMNGDDRINFEDLAVMKASFFGIPGPSGYTQLCLAPI